MGIRMAAVAAALCLAAPAWADAELKKCMALASDAQRLQCYDSYHKRQPGDASPKVAPRSSRPFERISLDKRWDLDSGHHDLFFPDTYKPMYVLVANWTDRTNPRPSSPVPGHTVTTPFSQRPIEAKYQFSFKSKFWQFSNMVSIWGAYTQSSRWQVYNSSDSRPFRDTNYEPEVFAVFPLARGDGFRMATLGYNHQSNGRPLPLSRSWNRIIGALYWQGGSWTIEARPWWRIPEGAGSDDNPDISDYFGRGELRVSRRFNEHHVSVQLRHSLRGGSRSHGSAQLDWVFPIKGIQSLHGQLQLFRGYSESLVDYNVRQTRIGLGITIAGWQ